MTITTVGAARHISPVVIATFVKHYVRQAKKHRKDRHLEATDELLFDEAFNIVKRFISLGTNDTVEALQAFTNTRIPSQPWSTVVHCLIPLSSCDLAAEKLIEYFGPEDLKTVVGGEKWWQVRGLNGVEGEWVAMTNDWKKAKLVDKLPDGEAKARAAKYAKFNRRHERHRKQKVKTRAKKSGQVAKAAVGSNPGAHEDVNGPPLEQRQAQEQEQEPGGSQDDADNEFVDEDEEPQGGDTENTTVPVEELDRLRRTILYCHGGGYFFGSPHTHRYQIVRLARKMGGRAFVPNYRKAPGYPWPCPLQDCLAAWFYLTQPPPGAKHKPVAPQDIIVAGDSAGGGLCLALLGVLRDLNLPMPAGAVLISPWCDMTHSFPSVLQNTDTDIIPPYGFVFKPSTLWPVPAQVRPEDSPQRGVPEESEGKASAHGHGTNSSDSQSTPVAHGEGTNSSDRKSPSAAYPPAPRPLRSDTIKVDIADRPNDPIQLQEQIQLYATNDQLYHPLCSPVLQGSLGGLPPLYIIAGDGEVLRDEVIMLAHRAARPEKYPLPAHLLSKNARARETSSRFNSQPTKVHLQVFDYQCHVLTLFSFTTAARFAYRAIASFCKYVTNAETNESNPFPELREEASANSSVFSGNISEEARKVGFAGDSAPAQFSEEPETLSGTQTPARTEGQGSSSNAGTMLEPPRALSGGSGSPVKKTGSRQSTNGVAKTQSRSSKGTSDLDEKRRKVTLGTENEYSGLVPLTRPAFKEHMIRERVDVRGAVRRMEDENTMQAVKMYTDHPELVGIIKEGPCRRYLEGRSIWDERYKRTSKKVEKRRKENEEKAEKMLQLAAESGLLNKKSTGQAVPYGPGSKRPAEWVEKEGGCSPLDIALLGETPPPSALAGRRDCDEALTLLRTSLHLKTSSSHGLFGSKPSSHQSSVDDMVGAPSQNIGEGGQGRRQKMHGLNLWVKSMGMFGRKTRKNAYFADDSKATEEETAGGVREGDVQAEGPADEVTSPRPEPAQAV